MKTTVKIKINNDYKGTSEEFANKISNFDSVNIYFVDGNFIRIDEISEISFIPHWKSIKYINSVYYFAGFNMLLASFNYATFCQEQYCGMVAIFAFVSTPIWGGAIPLAYNGILYLVKPRIVLNKRSGFSFEKCLPCSQKTQ